ncbi:MAG: rubrerythrin family protein [Rikenellaceae bacterium]|nr:rubrerythrin family protein [Rikenellaceae bacterium]
MKPNITGSKTEQNLLKAFAGESQARGRYTFFAKQTKKEGYEEIAKYFAKTAINEEEHSKIFFKYLERNGLLEITAAYPAGVIGSTLDNLKHAAESEYDEWYNIYPYFAQVAKEEGFDEIARTFNMIVEVERHHENRYTNLFELLGQDRIFNKEEKIVWECMKCGYHCEFTHPPGMCPICKHPTAYFEVFNDAY